MAAGGLPFDTKMPANDARIGVPRTPISSTVPVFGQPPTLLAEVAGNAARDETSPCIAPLIDQVNANVQAITANPIL